LKNRVADEMPYTDRGRDTVNHDTYTLLREVAKDIRQPALEAGRSGEAVEGVHKAVGFLVSEVYLHGDISLGKRADYAAALRAAAAAFERG
jgi:hypothetical protein